MGQSRREFIKSTSAALGVAGIAPLSVGRFATDALNPPQSIRESAIAPEPSITELAAMALDAAKSAGAEYADVRFGLLVERFWYLRPVDQRTILYTGLTRDGTFLIENGKVTKPVKNMRFNDSPIFVLNNLEAMGAPVRVSRARAASWGRRSPYRRSTFVISALPA